MDEDVTTDEVVGECRFTPSAVAPYAFPHYSPILSLPILLEGKVQGHVQLSVTSIPIADVLRLFTANGAPPLRPPAAAHYDAACVAYWLNRFERYFTKYCPAELAKLADTALGPLDARWQRGSGEGSRCAEGDLGTGADRVPATARADGVERHLRTTR
jgi:hypothetical protein